jgi:uncharacterized protein
VSAVLATTEDSWQDLFRQYGQRYDDPKLVLFSGCGLGQSAMGPFYCPGDEKVYIDLDFYQELKSRFRAPGDFAQAYVIAHEIGHHVQKLLGIMDQVEAVRQRMGSTEANALQVRVELQADCFAGVWANRAQESQKIRPALCRLRSQVDAACHFADEVHWPSCRRCGRRDIHLLTHERFS